MTDIALNDLSLKELKQLQKEVEKAVVSFEDRHKSGARAKLEEQARVLGYSLAELVGLPVKKSRAAPAARYAHPDDPTLTWSGRGRKPRWFTDALASGKSPEDLAL